MVKNWAAMLFHWLREASKKTECPLLIGCATQPYYRIEDEPAHWGDGSPMMGNDGQRCVGRIVEHDLAKRDAIAAEIAEGLSGRCRFDVTFGELETLAALCRCYGQMRSFETSEPFDAAAATLFFRNEAAPLIRQLENDAFEAVAAPPSDDEAEALCAF